MLQQTQVSTVIDYYQRFLDRFPTVDKLASATEQEVLRLWAGLGYYRRARQLHAAAKLIAVRADGFPNMFDEILQLPGVGRYTAGAIASFAYDQPTPIVEANTLRLYSRLLALRLDPRSSTGQAQLWDFAQLILPKATGHGASKINHAVMELGGAVCTPQKPDCELCPVKQLCPTQELGLQHIIPVAKAKPQFTPLTHVALIATRKTTRGTLEVLLRQNQTDEWWQGLWDFPRLDATAVSNKRRQSTDWISEESLTKHSIDIRSVDTGSQFAIKHSVTRFRISLHCIHVDIENGQSITKNSVQPWRWLAIQQAEELPITSPARKIMARLKSIPDIRPKRRF